MTLRKIVYSVRGALDFVTTENIYDLFGLVKIALIYHLSIILITLMLRAVMKDQIHYRVVLIQVMMVMMMMMMMTLAVKPCDKKTQKQTTKQHVFQWRKKISLFFRSSKKKRFQTQHMNL